MANMFNEDRIHEQLHDYSEREREDDHPFWNILAKNKRLKADEELSEWRTSSYPTIPKHKKNASHAFVPFSPLKTRQQDASNPLLSQELSHRYTFLNQHSRNDKPEENEQYLVKKAKNFELKLPKSPKYMLPTIHQEANQRLFKTKNRSLSDSQHISNAPVYYIRHFNQLKNKISPISEIGGELVSPSSKKNVGEIRSLRRTRIERLAGLKGRERGMSKSKSPTSMEIKKCLIFPSQLKERVQ